MISEHKYLITAIVMIPSLIFVVSLPQNAFSYQYQGVQMTESYMLLLMGGTAWIGGGLFESLIWMANPIAIIAAIRFLKESSSVVKIEPVLKTVIPKSKPSSHWLSLLAAAIAWSFSLWNEVLANEAGTSGKILSLELGYWLWVSSFTILTIGINYYQLRIRAELVL